MATPSVPREVARQRPRVWWFVILSFLALSVTINALQVLKIRSMQEPLQRCADMVFGRTAPPQSNVGVPAPPLKLHDLAGKAVELSASRPGKMTVLYLFSPQCGWCRRNGPNMKALAKGAGGRYDFVPISLTPDGVTEYVAELGIAGTVYTDPTPETRNAYGLGSTPQTIVVDSNGRIAKNWPGAYTGKLLLEVSSALDVKLPGLDK